MLLRNWGRVPMLILQGLCHKRYVNAREAANTWGKYSTRIYCRSGINDSSFGQAKEMIDTGRQFLPVVADIDKRSAKGFAEGRYESAKAVCLFVVESLAGFVENEHGWGFDQGPGQQDHA